MNEWGNGSSACECILDRFGAKNGKKSDAKIKESIAFFLGLRSLIIQTAKRGCTHTEMVVFLEIWLQVVHVYDGDAGRWICFRPGTGSAGPSELADVSVILSDMAIHQSPHSIAVPVTCQICI